jgi:hypothetical protein
MADENEIVILLREIRDSQRELWKLSVEAEARSKVFLEQMERSRSGRRLLGVLLGIIVALMAVQTYLMLQPSSDSDKPSTTHIVQMDPAAIPLAGK